MPTHTTDQPTTATLTLPDTFIAFHDMRRSHYLRYAHLHVGSWPAAEQVVRDTFGDLAITWTQVLCGPNPAAHAWAILKACVRAHAHPAHHRTSLTHRCGLATTAAAQAARRCLIAHEDDVPLLHRLRCSADQIADLTGLSLESVRAVVAHLPEAADADQDAVPVPAA